MTKDEAVPKLQALATELVSLSKTYQPSPPGAFGVDLPIVTKATELITTAQQPRDHAITLVRQGMLAAVIRTLLDLKVISAIPTLGSISLADLSSITDAQASLIERLLRVAVGEGFIHRTAEGEYAHTRISLGYTNGAGMMLSILYDEGLVPMVHLPEYLQAKKPQQGLVEPGGENNTTHNPVTWLAGQEGKTAFEIMEQNPERFRAFQKFLGMVTFLQPYVGYYDFSKLATSEPDRAVFVDVGGGHGHAIAEILKAHPEIRPEQCVLQDRPDVVELARKEGGLPDGVQFTAHDFFMKQPVKGARAYYLRAIAHDMSDTNLVKILKQIVSVMAPDSKVLIADNIVPTEGEVGMTGFMDLMMMCIGGKERTEKNFREVFDAAGLKVDGVYQAEGKTFAIVEGSLK